MTGTKTFALDLADAVRSSKNGSAKSLRRNLGVSAEVVGGACGVAGSTITRWENGARRPTGEAAVAWIRLLRRLALDDAAPDHEPVSPSKKEDLR